VTAEQAEHYSQWLLGEALPMGAVAKHEAVRCYDRFGEGWEPFDWDATSTVLRQRALPAGPQMPEAKRRCAELAEPGHPGRKRGEVQLGRATLQHSGTSQWVGLWCVAGNAPRGEQTLSAIEAIRRYCERHGQAPERALLRCDGQAGGGMRTLLACQQAAMAYLTRLSRYDVLDWSEVERHLEQAQFEPVEDSLSGPRREAAELGSLRLVAHDRRPGESEKPTMRSRIVISRFGASEPKRGVGIVRGPWQYEMFATNLQPEHWPAAETVAAYYGRCAQENRFLQEDSLLGLDRIFSYHLPGQHLASAVGLFCWNLRLALGAALHGLEPGSSASIELQAQSVLALPSSPLAAACEPAAAIAPAPEPLLAACRPSAAALPEPRQQTPEATAQAAAASSGPGPAEPMQEARRADSSPCNSAAPPQPPEAAAAPCSRPADWLEPLDAAPWSEVLEPYPGWSWDLSRGGLLCPSGLAVYLNRLHPDPQRRCLGVHFRAKRSVCSRCSLRSQCTESASPNFQKELTVRFRASQLPELDLSALARSLGSSRPASSTAAPPVCAPPRAAPEPAWLPPVLSSAGPLPVRWPMLLPSILSQAFAQLCLTLQIVISVMLPEPAAPLPPYIASGPAQRQRRRRTWQQRLEFNRLPSDTTVRIELHGARSDLTLLDLPPGHSPALLCSPAPSAEPTSASASPGEGRERPRATRAECRPRNRTG
jgi:hypothetical protein